MNGSYLNPLDMDNYLSLPVDAILLFGPTGAGKSPLGDTIACRGFFGRRAYHLDFGSELRSIANANRSSSRYSDSELAFVRGVLDRGLLLENEHFVLARKIISLFLERSCFASGDILVLNGIPRHVGQAKDLSTIAIVHALIVLDCSLDSILCRLTSNVGGDRTGRIDDHKDLVGRKLQIFIERTQPLIEHYAQEGSMIYRLPVTDASTTTDAYTALTSLATAYPPVTFIAEPPQR
ncbi:MAG: nucleoside monophosphate kinase [Nitrospirota bacterium]|nr:nucleoside monophosphate kinase [Nitrospirota bacterium]